MEVSAFIIDIFLLGSIGEDEQIADRLVWSEPSFICVMCEQALLVIFVFMNEEAVLRVIYLCCFGSHFFPDELGIQQLAFGFDFINFIDSLIVILIYRIVNFASIFNCDRSCWMYECANPETE